MDLFSRSGPFPSPPPSHTCRWTFFWTCRLRFVSSIALQHVCSRARMARHVCKLARVSVLLFQHVMVLSTVRSGSNPKDFPFKRKIDWKMDRFRKGGRSAARRRAQLVGRRITWTRNVQRTWSRNGAWRRWAQRICPCSPLRPRTVWPRRPWIQKEPLPLDSFQHVEEKRHAHQSREARCSCIGSKRRTSAKGTCTEPALGADWRA